MPGLTKRDAPTLNRFFGLHPFSQFRHEMADLLEHLIGEAESVPGMDVSETSDSVRVETDLPGFKAEDVDVEVNENCLTISGTHTEVKKEDEDRKYHRIERRRGTFSRSVVLPCPVQQDRIEAELKDGVLTVTLPKAETSNRQKIQVKG